MVGANVPSDVGQGVEVGGYRGYGLGLLVGGDKGGGGHTVPRMEVSIRARKVTRVMLPRRVASLRPCSVCDGRSSLFVFGSVGAIGSVAVVGVGVTIVQNRTEDYEVGRISGA